MAQQPIGNPVTEFDRPNKFFVFHKDKLLIHLDNGKVVLPDLESLEGLDPGSDRILYAGNLGKTACYAASPLKNHGDLNGLAFHGLRGLFGQMEDSLYSTAGRALQIVNWDKTHLFCSRCGSPADTRNNEGAQVCLHCGYLSYPRISPAIIVAILKGDRILLAHNRRFPGKRYSVIAGYVEMGENLEACTAREIREEVGIDVKNIRYFGSQPWSFSGSLMIGFTAQYAGGEIKVDQTEIAHAAWFSRDGLPEIPAKDSIARQLIDWFVGG